MSEKVASPMTWKTSGQVFSQGLKVKAPILILNASHISVHPNAEESSGFVSGCSLVKGKRGRSALCPVFRCDISSKKCPMMILC